MNKVTLTLQGDLRSKEVIIIEIEAETAKEAAASAKEAKRILTSKSPE